MSFDNFSKKELINFVEKLLERVDLLEKKVDNLNLKVAKLHEENQILKFKKNSSNSSIPPSNDISRPNQSLRQKSELKKGGQLGHKGHTLEMSSTPDKVICHIPSFCKKCGSNLTDLPEVLAERRQVIDIPPIIPIYTEHQSFSKTCQCGCFCKGDFPAHVVSPIQYGDSVESLIAYFSARQFLPFKRMSECLLDVFNLSICQSSIVNAITRFAQKGLVVYDKIKHEVINSEVIGSDETGVAVNGNKGWFWVWQNKLYTFISYSKSRGFDTISNLFSDNFSPQVIVTDCWAAQLKVKATTHQICIAHLLRELNYFIESTTDEWAVRFKALLLDALKLKEKIVDYQIQNLERQSIESQLNELLTFEDLSKNTKQRAFQKRLIKHKEKLLPFLYSENIPSDNNASERAKRNVKVKQKISGQFVSDQKVIDFAIIRSIIDTAIKNKLNIFDSLKLIAQFRPE